MSFADLSSTERELLRRSEDLSVVPYADTPKEDATRTRSQSCADVAEDQASPPEDPELDDGTDWCRCGRCVAMPTAAERLCCRDMPQCTDRDAAYITEDEYFFTLCLDVHVLRVAYCELIERNEEPEMDIHKTINAAVPRLEMERGVRDAGAQAVWSLSSCKPGYGINHLLDDCLDNYWQSDGILPHEVNIQFHRKMAIHAVVMYVDYSRDESYTPKSTRSYARPLLHLFFKFNESKARIGLLKKASNVYATGILKAGGCFFFTAFSDDIAHRIAGQGLIVSFRISVRVGSTFHDLQVVDTIVLNEPTGWVRITPRDSAGRPVRAFHVQIAVLENHKNGQDTHIRHMKVFTPLPPLGFSLLPNVTFSSQEGQAYSGIR